MLVTINDIEKNNDDIVEPTSDQVIDEKHHSVIDNLYKNKDSVIRPESIEEKDSDEDTIEHVDAEEVIGGPNFQSNMIGGMGALGNLLNRSSPDYSELFKTYSQLFDQQDKNMEYLNGAINNLVLQLNKYKRNQSWKLRIVYILILITWIIMFIKF